MGFSKTEAISLLLGLCFRWNTDNATIPEQCYNREMEEGINGRTASQASYNVQISKILQGNFQGFLVSRVKSHAGKSESCSHKYQDGIHTYARKELQR